MNEFNLNDRKNFSNFLKLLFNYLFLIIYFNYLFYFILILSFLNK